jgi:hypothetical protein
MTASHSPHHHGQWQHVLELSLVPSLVAALALLFEQHRFASPPAEQPCWRLSPDLARLLRDLAQLLRDFWPARAASSPALHLVHRQQLSRL